MESNQIDRYKVNITAHQPDSFKTRSFCFHAWSQDPLADCKNYLKVNETTARLFCQTHIWALFVNFSGDLRVQNNSRNQPKPKSWNLCCHQQRHHHHWQWCWCHGVRQLYCTSMLLRCCVKFINFVFRFALRSFHLDFVIFHFTLLCILQFLFFASHFRWKGHTTNELECLSCLAESGPSASGIPKPQSHRYLSSPNPPHGMVKSRASQNHLGD